MAMRGVFHVVSTGLITSLTNRSAMINLLGLEGRVRQRPLLRRIYRLFIKRQSEGLTKNGLISLTFDGKRWKEV
jgi:hypothetical protein